MRQELQQRCDVIEEAYEFLLAYAAQGVSGEPGSQSGGQLREFLTRAAGAISGLGDLLGRVIDEEQLQPADRYRAYQAVVADDARRALAAMELMLAQTAISSQVIDNLNASIHVRALLTDLFLIDEILNGLKQPAT
jgi:hypothetical protein